MRSGNLMSIQQQNLMRTARTPWIPAAGWLQSYQREWVSQDVIAGLTAAAVVVPQSVAYAAIAGLPLVVGLYTAFVPLVVYALMGTSRPLSVTTTSTIALLTAAALRPVASVGSDAQLLAAAGTLTCLVGGILLVAAVLRLGVIASLISDPVLVGFKAGVGATIVVDQIPKLLGLQIPKSNLLRNVLAIAHHLPQVSIPTVLLAVALLSLQLGLQRSRPRAPAALVTVCVGIAASALVGLKNYGIALVGEVHRGLPSFALPNLSLIDQLWPAAVGIALMSFVETIAAGAAFRDPSEPRPEPNRELLAIGLTNLLGGCFHNQPSGGGTSQTAVNRRAGARSQIAGLVTAAVVIGVLLFLAPVVQLMPQAALAVVVVVPCAGMIKLPEFSAILQNRAMEFSWAVAALAGVLLLGTLRGIVVAVLLSFFALAFHGSRRPVFVLARKPGTNIFRPRSPEHPEDEIFPGLLLLKTEGMLHFANVQRVADLMWPFIDEYQPRVIVLDCSAIPDLEYSALKRLAEAQRKMGQLGISVWLAGLNPEPLRLIQKSLLGQTLGRAGMYHDLEQAVSSYLRRQSDETILQPIL